MTIPASSHVIFKTLVHVSRASGGHECDKAGGADETLGSSR